MIHLEVYTRAGTGASISPTLFEHLNCPTHVKRNGRMWKVIVSPDQSEGTICIPRPCPQFVNPGIYEFTFLGHSPKEEKTNGEFDKHFQLLANDHTSRLVSFRDAHDAAAFLDEVEKRGWAAELKARVSVEIRPPYTNPRKK